MRLEGKEAETLSINSLPYPLTKKRKALTHEEEDLSKEQEGKKRKALTHEEVGLNKEQDREKKNLSREEIDLNKKHDNGEGVSTVE